MRSLMPVVPLALLVLASCAAPEAARAAPPDTVVPAARTGEWWRRTLSAQLVEAQTGGHRIVFLGDSITEGWAKEGLREWRERWQPRHAINLGIGGDRTQHVLWRLDRGLLGALAAANNDVRACVVLIGTNNSNGSDNTAEEIGQGIVAIVRRLRAGLPQARVLLLAIFPRGEGPSEQRDKNAAASRFAAVALHDDPMVVCRDIGDRFLGPNGALPEDVMPDLLHLSARGYRLWADAIADDVDVLAR